MASKKVKNVITVSSSSSSSLMSDSKDELLEILLRLPHSASVIQRSLVCKRWHSLVFSDYFRTRFNNNHRHHSSLYLDPSYSVPYAVVIKFQQKMTEMVVTSFVASGICEYPDTKAYLDFLPKEWRRSMVEASCEALVLLSHLKSSPKYCVCNPLTRKWKILSADMPVLDGNLDLPALKLQSRTGLWFNPDQYGSNNELGRFIVMILVPSSVLGFGNQHAFNVKMFSSETGVWGQWTPVLNNPARMDLGRLKDSFTSEQFLYFPIRNEEKLVGFLAINPMVLNDCRVIDMPDGFVGGWMATDTRVCIGVVRGRLRVSQLLKNKGIFNLKIWELRNENVAAWVGVYDVRVQWEKLLTVVVMALHPNKGDQVLMMVNRSFDNKTVNSSICRYKIGNRTYTNLCKLPDVKITDYKMSRQFNAYTLVHTSSRL